MSKSIALLLGLALACCILLITSSSVHAWKFAAVGDIVCKDAPKVATAIKKAGNNVTLLLGDLGYSTSSKCIGDAFKGMNVKPTVGNHDKTSDVVKVFGKGDTGTTSFSNVRFLSINTEGFTLSKVAGLLNKYKNDTNYDFIIPIMHKPLVTNPSAHHTEEAKYRSQLIPLFVSNGKVQLVLNGHNHGFQQCSSNGINFMTAGTGGRDPYPWGSKMDDNCHNNISGTNGFLEVVVDGAYMVGYFKDMNGGIREETTFSIVK